MVRTRFIRTRKAVYLFALCLIAAASAGAGKYLVINEMIRPAEVCMPMNGSRYRLNYVIDLYHRGLCEELVIIGGKEGGLVSYASREADFALQEGVLPTDITIDETNIFSSYAELVQLRSFLELEYSQPVLVTIVTSEFHTRRTKMIWNWLFEDQSNLTLLSVSRNSDINVGSWLWWASSDSRKLVSLEYVKIVFYFLRYRIPIPPLNDYLSKYDKIND